MSAKCQKPDVAAEQTEASGPGHRRPIASKMKPSTRDTANRALLCEVGTDEEQRFSALRTDRPRAACRHSISLVSDPALGVAFELDPVGVATKMSSWSSAL